MSSATVTVSTHPGMTRSRKPSRSTSVMLLPLRHRTISRHARAGTLRRPAAAANPPAAAPCSARTRYGPSRRQTSHTVRQTPTLDRCRCRTRCPQAPTPAGRFASMSFVDRPLHSRQVSPCLSIVDIRGGHPQAWPNRPHALFSALIEAGMLVAHVGRNRGERSLASWCPRLGARPAQGGAPSRSNVRARAGAMARRDRRSCECSWLGLRRCGPR